MSLTLSSTAGSDYNDSVVTMLKVGSGVKSASYSVPIMDDSNIEDSETFTVILSTNESNVTIGGDTATVTILDEDSKLFLAQSKVPFHFNSQISLKMLSSNGTYTSLMCTCSTFIWMYVQCAHAIFMVNLRCGAKGYTLWCIHLSIYKEFVLFNTVCPDLSDPSNGVVKVNSQRTDDTAEYSCDEGFELVGDVMRTCMSNSEWSGKAPSCMRNPGNELIIV